MEIRSLITDYNVSKEGHISGRAICFNEVSNVLYDADTNKFFREVIEPAAITPELIAGSDIRMLLNHNREQMLARNNKGKGSLKVELRDDGVYFDFSIPNTTLGHDTAELIKRGDVVGCSFAFTDKGATWDFSNREMPFRKVNNIVGLYDLSIVFTPAYDQTSVSARSIDEAEAALREQEKPQETVNEEVTINTTEERQEAAPEIEDTAYLDELKKYKDTINNYD